MALLKITHFWSNLLEWGYQHNLLEWGYQHNFPIWRYQHIFGALVWCMSFVAFYGLYRDWWFIYAWLMILCFLVGGKTPASSESRLFAIERKACSERRQGGGFTLNVSMGARERNQAKADFSR